MSAKSQKLPQQATTNICSTHRIGKASLLNQNRSKAGSSTSPPITASNYLTTSNGARTSLRMLRTLCEKPHCGCVRVPFTKATTCAAHLLLSPAASRSVLAKITEEASIQLCACLQPLPMHAPHLLLDQAIRLVRRHLWDILLSLSQRRPIKVSDPIPSYIRQCMQPYHFMLSMSAPCCS